MAEEFKRKPANEYETRSLTNPTDKEFVFHWDKVPYVVPARTTVPFPHFLCLHGAKHLADRIMADKGMWDDVILANGDRKAGNRVPSPGDRDALALWLIDQELEIAQTVVEGFEKGEVPEKLPMPDFTPQERSEIKETPLTD